LSYKAPMRDARSGFLYGPFDLDVAPLREALGAEPSHGLVAALEDWVGWLRAADACESPTAGPVRTALRRLRRALRAASDDARQAPAAAALLRETDSTTTNAVGAWYRHRAGQGLDAALAELTGDGAPETLAHLLAACDDAEARLQHGRPAARDRRLFAREVVSVLSAHGYADPAPQVRALRLLLDAAGCHLSERRVWELAQQARSDRERA